MQPQTWGVKHGDGPFKHGDGPFVSVHLLNETWHKHGDGPFVSYKIGDGPFVSVPLFIRKG